MHPCLGKPNFHASCWPVVTWLYAQPESGLDKRYFLHSSLVRSYISRVTSRQMQMMAEATWNAFKPAASRTAVRNQASTRLTSVDKRVGLWTAFTEATRSTDLKICFLPLRKVSFNNMMRSTGWKTELVLVRKKSGFWQAMSVYRDQIWPKFLCVWLQGMVTPNCRACVERSTCQVRKQDFLAMIHTPASLSYPTSRIS